jgi:hypothetical protein
MHFDDDVVGASGDGHRREFKAVRAVEGHEPHRAHRRR